VFEPFYTTKEVGEGSGLGLSMVYGFAQQSGGFAAIESEQGRGTTVTVYLPRTEDDQTPKQARAADAALQTGRGEIVLLVEDEADVRDVTTKLLERLGYTVLAAEDGAGALEIAANTGRIDLLLSDMVLPGGMNGIDICHRLRERRPDLKCLFMTGYASLPDRQVPDGTEFLNKPVAIRDLAARTKHILAV
jgi:CheY-like chemotaxis protein